MFLTDITMKDFKKGLKKTKTLIVPYGTVEAHGTHLPLSTDTRIMWEVVKAAVKKKAAFVAPPLHYGVCTSTSDHPGTIGLSCETLRCVTKDIVRDGYNQGLRRFILISGHGGSLHVSAMKEAAEELTKELKGVTIAALAVYEILPKEAAKIPDTKNDSHAGEIETSLVLYLAEKLVQGRAKEEYPKLPKPIVARDKLKYWPGAVWGDPSKATKKKGEKFFKVMVKSVAGLIGKVDRYR